MFVGLLFYIPEQAQGTYRKSKIPNPWRRWKYCCCYYCCYYYCTPHIMTPTPWFSKNHHNLQNSSKENVIVLCFSPSEPDLRYTKIFLPQHFMFVGLLFYIKSTSLSKHKAHIENPKFLTPGGGEIIVVVIFIVSVVVATSLPCASAAARPWLQTGIGCIAALGIGCTPESPWQHGTLSRAP